MVTICSYYLPGWHVAGCAELCWVDVHLADWHGILSCHQNPFPQHLWGWFYFIWQSHIHPFDLILFDKDIQPPTIYPLKFICWIFWELISSIWVKYFIMCVLMTFHLLSFHSVGFTFVQILQIQVAQCTLLRKGREKFQALKQLIRFWLIKLCANCVTQFGRSFLGIDDQNGCEYFPTWEDLVI